MSPKISTKPDELNHQLRKTPIAIIGMASIFPQASHLSEYWENILNKVNCISEVPDDRWRAEDYYDPDPKAADKSYCKRGGFLPDIDFDPTEFGMPPNVLEATDVSQLLSLVVAKEALEDAGYGEGIDFKRETTGCILGVVGVSMKSYVPLMARLQYPIWERVLKAGGVSDEDTQKIITKIKLAYAGWEENSFPGSLSNVIAGRIANRFDLGGTNCVLDAACATSLAAIKMSVMELVEGRADMMISGGVDTDNSIGVYMSFSKTPAFSKGESVRSFDAASDGMMAGEGIGMLVLKRLDDAERDGNRIYAVIRGMGSSSDGRFKSIYAPRPAGQSVALRRAYHEAGYAPQSVGLIEAHGTGTPAGDPAEFQGLRDVFDENNPERQYIALGSVKSQIGHTKGAAGAAGMIKVAMALHHKILPPTINVVKPNPKLDIEHSSFYINSETRPWFRRGAKTPRRAGVSAFGFGGTNFHFTLEEYEREQTQAYRVQSTAQMVLLSAPTSQELLALGQTTLEKLQKDGGGFYNELAEQSKGKIVEREHARLGFVADTLPEAVELLQTSIDLLQQRPTDEGWEHPKGIYYRSHGMDAKGKVVALFSGQGSQYLEMGHDLACNFPPVREAFSKLDGLFVQDGLEPISSRVYPAPVFEPALRDVLSATLTNTEHAQPAIGAMSVGLYSILAQAGFAPDFVAGHSFGELTALWSAGVIGEKDYYFLAKARGKAMMAPKDANFDPGTMLAVKGDAAAIQEEIRKFPAITLANWNSNQQVVLAGSKAAVCEVQKYLTEKGYSTVNLPVSAAFHTPLVAHAQEPFARAVDEVTFKAPRVRLFSNSSGKEHSSDPEEIRRVLKAHILNPVLFRDEIENIYAEGGYFFVEFGPKNVLTNLVKSILGERPHVAVALNASPKKNSDRQMREAVLQLRVYGVQLGNVDPYAAAKRTGPARKKSAVTVKLNGGLYISPKTRDAFENSLKDGFKVTMQASQAAPAVKIQEQTQPARVEKAIPAVETRNSMTAAEPMTTTSMEIESSLAQLREQQSEAARLHEQYLKNEAVYGNTFAKLSEQEMALVSNASADKLEKLLPVLEGLERSMTRFHEHQAETLRVHAQYLKSQEEYTQNFLRLAQMAPVQVGQPTARVEREKAVISEAVSTPLPVVEKPLASIPVVQKVSAPVMPAVAVVAQAAPVKVEPKREVVPAAAPVKTAATTYDTETLTKALLNVVSEKTGYPAEMLELDTDMEADLGIDSIKRVEIMGAMRTLFPELPKADPETFAEVRTLGQTVTYMLAGIAGSQAAATEPLPLSVAAPVVETVQTGSVGADAETLTRALLSVVSEKTGYPVEMLELDTDMEADLGIDSIKRVEIMGAMRTLFPELPKADPESFAEVRTLGQIVTYMHAGRSAGAAVPTSPEAPAAVAVAEAPAPAVSAMVVEVAEPGLDTDALTKALLGVVSEKTGYPVEMLELDTDMEADLGIDSIKRVEIMGAMRTLFPELPQADAEAFADVRTLGQIVEYLGNGAAAEKLAEAVAAPVSTQPEFSIPRGVVSLKSLPEPDLWNYSLAEGAVCLLIDSGTTMTASLAKKLQERAWKVVVLSLPVTLVAQQMALPTGVERVTLSDASETQLESRLNEIAKKFGPVGAVIHLNPPYEKSDSLYTEAQKEIVKLVFLLAKHLKEALTNAAKAGNSAFLVVANLDGKFGLGNSQDFDPISAGLFGLAKTLNLEWDAVYCRAVDISPEFQAEQAAGFVQAELFDPNHMLTEVGYSPEGRVTLVVEQSMPEGVI